MSEHYNRQFTGMTCDKPSCDAEERPAEPLDWAPEREFIRAAIVKGWSIWVSRSRRTYCPEHRPDNSKTKMREVTKYV